MIQELLEQEATDHLERSHYERAEAGAPHRGYRNGYKQRHIHTAEGAIPVWRPQVRQVAEPFVSRLWGFLKGHSDVVQRLVVEMYARGLSTRDIEEALTDATGTCLLSRSAVSELTEALWGDYEAFSTRDLAGYVLDYLFLDAIYETLRQQGASRRRSCGPGGSCATAGKSCCTSRWGRRSATSVGWSSSAIWWPAGSGRR